MKKICEQEEKIDEIIKNGLLDVKGNIGKSSHFNIPCPHGLLSSRLCIYILSVLCVTKFWLNILQQEFARNVWGCCCFHKTSGIVTIHLFLIS